jgi:flagellar biosynthesis protein FlhF
MEQDIASMRIKSYFAGSVEQAIQEARQELGQEAMLITSRRSSPEARHLGAYEVVFGVQAATPPARPTGRATATRTKTPPADLSAELQNLRVQLQDIKSTLQLGAVRPQPQATSETEELYNELVDLDLARPLAREVIADALALREQPPQAAKPLRDLAAESIAKRIRLAAETGRERLDPGKIVAFVGPAGAGKTTTLVKFAVQEALAGRLPVRIVSVDPDRVGAHEKLRVFAGLLGVGFTAANTMQEFLEALDVSQDKHVVLIDTPGYGVELESVTDIAGSLARLNRKETHLVLPASMKRADLMRAVRRYAEFKPDYLLFTRLDETESYGAAVSTALDTDKPLSYFTTGQSVPEHIEPASRQTLLASLFRRETVEAVSAA